MGSNSLSSYLPAAQLLNTLGCATPNVARESLQDCEHYRLSRLQNSTTNITDKELQASMSA